jgi:NAD(P)H-flavin reductase
MSTHITNPMAPTLLKVKKIRKETYDTFTLELSSPNGDKPWQFAPGQFNMLYMFGLGESAISICGDPTKPDPLIHTARAVGTVTKAMSKLKAGDLIGVRGPFGSSWPVDAAVGSDVVIVCGGIGLPPLRPVIYQIISQRRKYGKVVLLYGARTPEDLLYMKEVETWRARHGIDVAITVDRATGSWKGNVGVVTTLIPRAKFDLQNSIAMVCGPEIMIRFVTMDLQKQGIGPDRIYVSMERSMKCGIGVCGHCQFGPTFVCKDGPVFRYDQVKDLMGKREI